MESLTSQTVNGNGPLLAETAPLLGSNHTTAARERRDPDVEDGRGEDDATAAVAAENNGSSDDPAKPKVNMTALLPALAIGVRLTLYLFFPLLYTSNERYIIVQKPQSYENNSNRIITTKPQNQTTDNT